ncbi:hypothetical protein [Ktedonobacter racemifer]|nr:hypothetical protein [Ktedonobacter racemifer]
MAKEENMAFHSGTEYKNDDVSIGVPAREILLCLSLDADIAHFVDHWISQARQREDIYYFSAPITVVKRMQA